MSRFRFVSAILILCCGPQSPAQTGSPSSAAAEKKPASSDLATSVARMARISGAFGSDFSSDGKWVSFISALSGIPQVWVVPAEGGFPQMVTNGDDPAVNAEWSPAGDWLAVTIAPGGGLNSQVYVVKPDGTGLRRLTLGGKDNNGFDSWTEDGKQIAINSSRLDPASRDSFLIDVASGDVRLVSKNPGIGAIANIAKDGRRALLFRLRSRGDDNLYLLDLATGKDLLL